MNFFYNKTIINHSSHVWVWVRGGYLYRCYASHTCVLNLGEIPTLSKRGTSVKSGGFVWVSACVSFVVMPRTNQSFYYNESRMFCPPLWKYQWLNWILFCQRLNWTVKKLWQSKMDLRGGFERCWCIKWKDRKMPDHWEHHDHLSNQMKTTNAC